jgi:hypothetical protein
MKLSATLKSGVIFFSDIPVEVSGLALFPELQENNPAENSVTISPLIF